jgi:D-alanyl-lipoteichoic acid acyltransferase DltB (MBOAT superfamily)
VNVPSFAFLGFAALVAIAINLSSRSAWRRAVLLVANLAFVLTFTRDPVQLAPFGLLLAVGYGGVKLMERVKARGLFVVLVVAFCVLKRYTFIPGGALLPFVYFTVGMSYVFFRVLHLVIDAFQDALPGRIGLLDYVNYTLNFTSLVSGPIQLYQDYHRTESQPLRLDGAAAAAGLERIVTGFFKVAIVSPLLSALHGWSVASLMTAVFPVYLYFNFSGYTDFVIGVARFLRLELPENFNHPFIASSFIDFWGRWHITLANWVKTYIYSPLLITLMRRFPSPRVEPYFGVLAYFVAFFFVGLWHGQTSMFVFLGVLLGFGVSVNKLYQILMIRRLGRARYRKLCDEPVYAALSRALTLVYFAVCSLWFWSTWEQLGRFAGALGWTGVAAALLLMVGAASVLLTGVKFADDRLAEAARGRGPAVLASPYARTAWYTALAVVTVSVTVILNAPAPQIVYKAF